MELAPCYTVKNHGTGPVFHTETMELAPCFTVKPWNWPRVSQGNHETGPVFHSETMELRD